MSKNLSVQKLINHIAIVNDRSGSMSGLNGQVDKIVATLIKHLAVKSEQMDQETRVTVYEFDDKVWNVLYDQDVLRLAAPRYTGQGGGMTNLFGAIIQSQEELAETAQRYGDHAFLTYVLTDGHHNASPHFMLPAAHAQKLADLINGQEDNWTVAVMVPDILAKKHLSGLGLPKDNLMIWDVSSDGLAEVERQVTQVTDSYLTARASGVRGSKTLFTNNVTKADVQAAGLKPIPTDDYLLLNVIPTKGIEIVIPKKSILKSRPEGLKHVEIQAFVQANGHPYVTGRAFYELVKSEKIDGNKKVIVVENATGLAYSGPEARKMVGLDMYSTRAKPLPVDKVTGKREFDIFIQSTSVNRHLPIHTSRVLLLVK